MIKTAYEEAARGNVSEEAIKNTVEHLEGSGREESEWAGFSQPLASVVSWRLGSVFAGSFKVSHVAALKKEAQRSGP